MFYFVFAIIFALYGLLNYYIGLRYWQGLFSYLPHVSTLGYWSIFWLVSLSYLLVRVGEKFLPGAITQFLSVLGSYWLGIMFYSFLTLLIVDFVRLLDKIFAFLPTALKSGPMVGIALCLLIAGTVIYGAWNARHPIVNHYELTLDKRAGTLNELHIIMVSDIHLGTIMDNGRLTQMVNLINAQHPDLILIAGDMIDENVERVIEKEMHANLTQLQARYGTYAVLGNHEYIGGHVREAIQYLEESGVHVLKDQRVQIVGGIYLVGRDDQTGERFGGGKRQPLITILQGVEPTAPVIVLDHQPSHLQEPEEAGVDLQLSGHTHQGQLFPNNLITRRIFQDDFGLLEKGPFHLIVSSGYGTWGPPLRVGNKPEIVDILLRFGGGR